MHYNIHINYFPTQFITAPFQGFWVSGTDTQAFGLGYCMSPFQGFLAFDPESLSKRTEWEYQIPDQVRDEECLFVFCGYFVPLFWCGMPAPDPGSSPG
jgi:hypothetical protein